MTNEQLQKFLSEFPLSADMYIINDEGTKLLTENDFIPPATDDSIIVIEAFSKRTKRKQDFCHAIANQPSTHTETVPIVEEKVI